MNEADPGLETLATERVVKVAVMIWPETAQLTAVMFVPTAQEVPAGTEI